jgi:hypothetical protein
MSPVSFSTIAELVSEARADLVFIRTLDHAPAQDSLEAERRQVNRRAGTVRISSAIDAPTAGAVLNPVPLKPAANRRSTPGIGPIRARAECWVGRVISLGSIWQPRRSQPSMIEGKTPDQRLKKTGTHRSK